MAHGRLERTRVARVEVEDASVRGRSVAAGQAPLLERSETPEGPEARADVLVVVALPAKDPGEGGHVAALPAQGLERAERRRVVGLVDQVRLEDRRGTRELVTRFGRPVDPLAEQRGQLGELAAMGPSCAPRHDAREAVDHELVVRRLTEGSLVRLHRGAVVAEVKLVDLRHVREVPGPVLRGLGLCGELLDRRTQTARVVAVLEQAGHLLRRHGVRRVERERLLERRERLSGGAEPRPLDLGQGQPHRQLLVGRRGEVDAAADRAGGSRAWLRARRSGPCAG